MKTSSTIKPPPHPFYGEYSHRGLDPFHRDAFPEEFQRAAPNQHAVQGEGWFLTDAYGTEIGFVLDGTEIPAPKAP